MNLNSNKYQKNKKNFSFTENVRENTKDTRCNSEGDEGEARVS